MEQLNLPPYKFKIKSSSKGDEIWDEWRKRYILLTPEEWVRQNFGRYMMDKMDVPAGRMAVEISLKVHRLNKRADMIIYGDQGNPLVVVECKAPSIPITQDTFDQVARYNISLKAPVLIVTNGLDHYCCTVDFESKAIQFVEEFPSYRELQKYG